MNFKRPIISPAGRSLPIMTACRSGDILSFDIFLSSN